MDGLTSITPLPSNGFTEKTLNDFNELKTLLKGYGYKELQGKGSRVKFFREKPRNLIILHKPHPGEILLDYMVNEVIKNLKI